MLPQMIVYAVIATDSVAARGLVNGWCLPRSGRRDVLSVAITAFIFIRVILRIIVFFKKYTLFLSSDPRAVQWHAFSRHTSP